MACVGCDEFCGAVSIRLPETLERVYSQVVPAVQSGRLIVASGDLARSDYIECDLRCAACGQRFELRCETYHGGGGEWRVLDLT
jgi:hypothetical protein